MSDYKISKEGSTEVFPADSTEVHESSPGVSETINGTETMESTEVVSRFCYICRYTRNKQ